MRNKFKKAAASIIIQTGLSTAALASLVTFIIIEDIVTDTQTRIQTPANDLKVNARYATSIKAACPQIGSFDEAYVTNDYADLSNHPDFKIVEGETLKGSILHTSKTQKLRSELNRVLQRLHNFKRNEAFLAEIDSPGGSYHTAKSIADKMANARGHFITSTKDQSAEVSSAASIILIAGDFGYRYMHQHAKMVIHAVRNDLSEEGLPNKFAEDYPEGSAERKSLEDSNSELRAFYQQRSTIGISNTCINALVEGKKDVLVDAFTAKDLGFIDNVILEKSNMMAVLPNSPRMFTSDLYLPLSTSFKYQQSTGLEREGLEEDFSHLELRPTISPDQPNWERIAPPSFDIRRFGN